MGILYDFCNSSVNIKLFKKKNKFSRRNAERKWRTEDLKVEGAGLGSCTAGWAILDKLLHLTEPPLPHQSNMLNNSCLITCQIKDCINQGPVKKTNHISGFNREFNRRNWLNRHRRTKTQKGDPEWTECPQEVAPSPRAGGTKARGWGYQILGAS